MEDIYYGEPAKVPVLISMLVPQQARSRETEKKLLSATLDLLGTRGLEGTTIPRVAEQAGMTPGAIYRRFPDKNALIERVILNIITTQADHLRTTFTRKEAGEKSLFELIETLVRSSLDTHRRHIALLKALRQFVQASENTVFKREAAALELMNLAHITDVLLTHEEDIRHPYPRMAVSMALAMLTGTLAELVVVDNDLSYWRDVIPGDSNVLASELSLLFARYLGTSC